MTSNDFWTHLKDSVPMALLGSLVNFFYSVLPIKRFKDWSHFFIVFTSRTVSLLLCVFFGLLASFVCKSLEYTHYIDAASALGALGGRKILDAIYSLMVKYVKSYEKKIE